MLFMAEERAAQQASEPLLSCADIMVLFQHFLPWAAVTTDEVIEQMHERHRQRRAAISSAYLAQRHRPG